MTTQSRNQGPMAPMGPWRDWLINALEFAKQRVADDPLRPEAHGDGSLKLLAEDLDISTRRVYDWLHKGARTVKAWRVEDCLWCYFHNTGILVTINDIWQASDILDLYGANARRDRVNQEAKRK